MKANMKESQFATISRGLCSKMRTRLLMGGEEAWRDIESMMTAALAGTWVGSGKYAKDFVEWHNLNTPEKELVVELEKIYSKVLEEKTKERLEKKAAEATQMELPLG